MDPVQLGPNITFIALKDNKIIGYAMFSIVFLTRENKTNIYKLFAEANTNYVNDIFQSLAPQNLFNIDSLSVLSSYNGHHVSLILLYHGLDFASQFRNALSITHLVSFSASIATKHNLVDHLGFGYFGRNIFINEDYSDTLDMKRRGNVQLILQEYARHLLSVLRGSAMDSSPVPQITTEVVHIAIIIYQMAAIFNFKNSSILELLIFFSVNDIVPLSDQSERGKYFQNNLNLYVNDILQKNYAVGNWRREPVVYLTPPTETPFTSGNAADFAKLKIGLAGPKKIDGAKAPIYYGYDQILYIYRFLSTFVIGSILPSDLYTTFTTEILPDINSAIGGDITKKYDIDYYQIRAINDLFSVEELQIYGVTNSLTRETYINDMILDLNSISKAKKGYDIANIDTVTRFDRLMPYLETLGGNYLNGGTKNFIRVNNDTTTASVVVIEQEKLDYFNSGSDADLISLQTTILELARILNNVYGIYIANNQPTNTTIVIKNNLTLLDIAEYYATLTHIYNIRSKPDGNWFPYIIKKS